MAYDTTDPTLPPRMVMPVPMPQGIVPYAPSLNVPVSTENASTSAMVSPQATPNAPLIIRPPDTPVQQAQSEVNRLHNTGSGIDQVHNGFARGLLKAADITGAIAGSVFAPLRVAESLIPGTSEHHDLLVHRADNRLAIAQQQEQAQTAEQDAQAQTQQRQALAKQEEAKADSLLNPQSKQVPGHLVIAGDGSAAGYQDGDGNLHGLNDPAVPQGARDVAGNMAKAPVKVPLSEQLMTKDEAARLNAVWDPLAGKHKLPKGQFIEGMSHADATQLASTMNNVVGKQQGDTHVSISLQGLQNQENKNAGPNPNDPATQAAVASVANGSVKLADVFGRGATTAQKAAFVAQVKAVNPAYNSGDHDIENHLRNSFIAGKQGQTLTAFNTAQTHLQILAQAADALHNGNTTAFNSLGQQFAQATGSAAPTNFNAVKNAVKGEIARALTGNVTVSEQSELDKDFNNASSPAQIAGVAKKYTQLIEGKKGAMRDTYNAGQQGQVNFGNTAASSTSTATHRYNEKTGKIEAIQ